MNRDKFSEHDRKSLENAGEKITKKVGIGENDIKSLLSDEEKLKSMFSKITSSDMDKISDLLNHPDKLDTALSSPKAKQNIKKFLG